MKRTGVQKLSAFITIDWYKKQVITSDGKLFNRTYHTYRFDRIGPSYLIQEGKTKSKKNLVSRIIIGDLLAGGIGVFAGIMSAGKQYTIVRSMKLVIQLKHTDSEEESIKLIGTLLKTSSIAYKIVTTNVEATINELKAVAGIDK